MLKNLYGKVGVWRSKSELVSHLANSCVVYKDHGLLVINKPFNLGNSSTQSSDISIKNILPDLQSALRLPFLEYISSPEKFATGLLLLGTEPDSKKKVLTSKKRAVSLNLFYETYLTLTDGIPRLNKGFETIDSFKYKYSTSSNSIEPVLTRTLYSKRKLSTSKSLSRYLVHTETLSKRSQGGVNASLVAVSPSSLSNHFIQLYMADLLSPVLGDFLYSYRVRKINGVPVKVSHVNSPPSKVQKLSPEMMKTLGLRPGEEDIIPKHLHRYRVILKKFVNKNEDLVLVAPLPEYFMKSASTLELNMDVLESWKREHTVERTSSQTALKQ